MADIEYVGRVEYEKRHDDLSNNFNAQIARLDARIDKAEIAGAALRTQLDVRFDKIGDKIDASEKLLSTQFTSLKDDIYRTKTSDLWRVLGWAISFILGGGGMVGLFQLFHLLK
jgi:hypothetical protein